MSKSCADISQTDLYALFRALSIPNIVVLMEVRDPTPLELQSD